MHADVALVTERRYTAAQAPPGDWYLSNILEDDRLLAEALLELGLTSRRVAWCDPTVDCRRFSCGVVRSTWDYFDRFGEFLAWMERVESLTLWQNDWETVRWNVDKHYLRDLEDRGVRVVPTKYVAASDSTPLGELLADSGWDEAVIKPCVSGAARHTHRLNRANAATVEETLAAVRRAEAFLIQPFQQSVPTHGELSLMVFDGRCTHAVRKVAKPGDFRVQDDHGGRVVEHAASLAEVAFAEQAVRACSPLPTYARVDLVYDNDQRLAVMELELVEPELWLRRSKSAARAMARAIARRT